MWHFAFEGKYYELVADCIGNTSGAICWRAMKLPTLVILVSYLTNISGSRLYGVEWQDYRSMMNRKGFARKRSLPNRGTTSHLPGETEENHKTSVMKAGVPAEIRTEHLSSTSLEHYHCTNLLSCCKYIIIIITNNNNNNETNEQHSYELKPDAEKKTVTPQ
jgi:hypothetical protein